MQRFHIWLVSLLVSGLWLALTMDRTSAASDAWEAARQPGAVLIMRHALAPGGGAAYIAGALSAADNTAGAIGVVLAASAGVDVVTLTMPTYADFPATPKTEDISSDEWGG